MEVDFSSEARNFLETRKNQSIDVDLSELSLDERVLSLLEAKASAHNSKFDNKVNLDQLKSVYNRGQDITDWVYCANKSTMQWAFARVNQFLYMQQGQKVEKAYRIADRDIAEGDLEYESEDVGKGYFGYKDLDFAVARLDLKKLKVSEEEANTKLEKFQGLIFDPKGE